MQAKILITALIAVFGLSACEAQMAEYDYRERFPIRVEERTAMLVLEPLAGGTVNLADTPAVAELSRDYLNRGAGGIEIAVGAKSAQDAAATAFARNVAEALVAQGVPAAAIAVSYVTGDEGSKRGRALIQFPIYVAIADECGAFKDRPEFTTLNENTYNFGCSIQFNTAAMVVDPRDLIDATASSGRWAVRSQDVVGKYMVGAKMGAGSESAPIVPAPTN